MYHVGNFHIGSRGSFNGGHSLPINHEYPWPHEPCIASLSLGEQDVQSKGYHLPIPPHLQSKCTRHCHGMCVYIKGIWQGVIDDSKFNKFFSYFAIDHAKDVWWDLTQKCIITSADEEMTSMLQKDKDLIFNNKQVIINMPSGAPTKKEPQGSNDILSMGSVSTFWMMGTTQNCMTWKSKTKVKLPSSASMASSGSETTLSASTQDTTSHQMYYAGNDLATNHSPIK